MAINIRFTQNVDTFFEIICNINLSTAYCLQGLAFTSRVPEEDLGLLAVSRVDR